MTTKEEQALELLRELEWISTFEGHVCPVCRGMDPEWHAGDPDAGHEPECRLKEVIS